MEFWSKNISKLALAGLTTFGFSQMPAPFMPTIVSPYKYCDSALEQERISLEAFSAPLLNLITREKSQIVIAMFTLAESSVLNALLDAANRGVSIYILLDKATIDILRQEGRKRGSFEIFNRLVSSENVVCLLKSFKNLMHLKLCIFSNAYVVGDTNLSFSGLALHDACYTINQCDNPATCASHGQCQEKLAQAHGVFTGALLSTFRQDGGQLIRIRCARDVLAFQSEDQSALVKVGEEEAKGLLRQLKAAKKKKSPVASPAAKPAGKRADQFTAVQAKSPAKAGSAPTSAVQEKSLDLQCIRCGKRDLSQLVLPKCAADPVVCRSCLKTEKAIVSKLHICFVCQGFIERGQELNDGQNNYCSQRCLDFFYSDDSETSPAYKGAFAAASAGAGPAPSPVRQAGAAAAPSAEETWTCAACLQEYPSTQEPIPFGEEEKPHCGTCVEQMMS